MPDPTALRALALRLDEATGPSRELDYEIEEWLYHDLLMGAQRIETGWVLDLGHRGIDGVGKVQGPQPYTASLDEAAKLCKAALPDGWIWDMTSTGSAWVASDYRDAREPFSAVVPGQPALALVKAIVAAALAQAEGE